mmetsp:Transcript_73611/g.193114  ORF Transcript_73611/g.193114 Transcript_73611/m.193114 type:complete len:484 (-) Transcript_73611:220-1671(-)
MSVCSALALASSLSETTRSALSEGGAPRSLKGQLVKTRFCKHFARGFCRYEDTCAYAHGLQELKSRPNLVKTKICVNFLAGACSEGSVCKYAHDRAEVRTAYSDSQSAISLDRMSGLTASTTQASTLGASGASPQLGRGASSQAQQLMGPSPLKHPQQLTQQYLQTQREEPQHRVRTLDRLESMEPQQRVRTLDRLEPLMRQVSPQVQDAPQLMLRPPLSHEQLSQAASLADFARNFISEQQAATRAKAAAKEKAAQQAAARAEREASERAFLQEWDMNPPYTSSAQAMTMNLAPPVPLQPTMQSQPQLQPHQSSITEQMLQMCMNLPNSPDKAALTASVLELLARLDEESAPPVSPAAARWGSLASAATRAARKSCLTEGTALLAYHRADHMSFDVGQIVSFLLLRDASWASIFPELSKRCSRQIAMRLNSHLTAAPVAAPTIEAAPRMPPGLGGAPETFGGYAQGVCQVRSMSTDIRVIGA